MNPILKKLLAEKKAKDYDKDGKIDDHEKDHASEEERFKKIEKDIADLKAHEKEDDMEEGYVDFGRSRKASRANDEIRARARKFEKDQEHRKRVRDGGGEQLKLKFEQFMTILDEAVGDDFKQMIKMFPTSKIERLMKIDKNAERVDALRAELKRRGKLKEEVELDEAYKTPEEAKAYEAGKNAWRAKKKYDANPNKDPKLKAAWSRGHNEARAKFVKKYGSEEEKMRYESVELEEATHTPEKILGSKPSQSIKSKDQWIKAAKGMGLVVKSPSTTPDGDNNSDMYLTAFDKQGNMKGTWYKTHGVFKESVQLDEVSKKTLGSYIKKASQNAANNKANAQLSFKRGKDELAFAQQDKANKRLKGIEKATDRLTKEEVELEEAKMTYWIGTPKVEKGKIKKHHTAEVKASSEAEAKKKAADFFENGYTPNDIKVVMKYDESVELEEAAQIIRLTAKDSAGNTFKLVYNVDKDFVGLSNQNKVAKALGSIVSRMPTAKGNAAVKDAVRSGFKQAGAKGILAKVNAISDYRFSILNEEVELEEEVSANNASSGSVDMNQNGGYKKKDKRGKYDTDNMFRRNNGLKVIERIMKARGSK